MWMVFPHWSHRTPRLSFLIVVVVAGGLRSCGGGGATSRGTSCGAVVALGQMIW